MFTQPFPEKFREHVLGFKAKWALGGRQVNRVYAKLDTGVEIELLVLDGREILLINRRPAKRSPGTIVEVWEAKDALTEAGAMFIASQQIGYYGGVELVFGGHKVQHPRLEALAL